MRDVLLDTDILSEVLKRKHPRVNLRSSAYLASHQEFSFSAITRYEILRGLLHKRAAQQLRQFEYFCERSEVYAVTDSILDRAAELWVDGQRRGRPNDDADLLIAATAMEQVLVLATGNTHHFEWIAGLEVDDWRSA